MSVRNKDRKPWVFLDGKELDDYEAQVIRLLLCFDMHFWFGSLVGVRLYH
jgi:hypothetical protein